MEIIVTQASILEADVDVIVNAANSQGLMGGGVAGAIRRAAGEAVEQEATAQAPVAVGKAILTTAGKLPYKGIIHAPTMVQPSDASSPEMVYKATQAAIALAQARGFQSIALPGMGTGVGQVPVGEAARAMVEAIRDSAEGTLKMVILTDVSEQVVSAWQAEVSRGEHLN